MTIAIECPECGVRNRFPDHLAGKRGRCKSCKGRIDVRRARKKTGKRKKQQSSNSVLLIGLAIGLFLLVGAGAIMFLNSDDPVDNGIANDQNSSQEGESRQDTIIPPTVSENSESGSPRDNSKRSSQPDMESSQEAENGAISNGQTSTTTDQGGFSQKSTTQINQDQLSFTRSSDWKISADGLESSTQFEPGKEIKIGFQKDSLRGSGVVYPKTASPYVAVRSGTSSKATYEIYDVTSGRKIGETAAGNSSSLAALAPDGAYLALCTSVAKEIEVFDVQAKKSLGVLQLSETERFQISSLAIWNDRLIALSSIQKGFKVWELPSGKLVQHVTAGDKFNPDYGHCYSANGKYLAVDGQFLEKRVDIYETLSGEVVGSISPAGKVRVNELEALGFSLDGKQLCISYGVDIYSQPSRKYSRVIVWDLEPGTVASDFEIEPKLKEQLDPVYKSHTLQSIPGGNRWLAYSRGIIDANTEQLIYSFDKQENVNLLPSRKVMGPNWVLSVTNTGDSPKLEQMIFTEDSLMAGSAAASAGGIASDAKMPPLTPTEFGRAPETTPTQQWEIAPDLLNAQNYSEPIKINSRGVFRDVAFARGPDPVVALRAGIDEDLDDPKISGYEQTREIYAQRGLELEKPQPLAKESEIIAFSSSGSEVAKFTVPFSGQLKSISPSAKLAVLEEHRTNGRLDIYGLENDGRHLIGWRPFGGEGDKTHRELKQVEFIDDQHLATLSENYKLVVWKIPSLEPAWRYDETIDFVVSPMGKHVCLVTGGILGAKSISLFESSTGKGLGQIDFDGKITAMAYHHSGKFLALATDSEANKTIRIVDMSLGKLIEEIPIPTIVRTLAWTGTDNLLLNGKQLLNRPLGAIVWNYTSPEILIPNFQVNDQFSFAAVFGDRAVLHSVDIPESSIAAKLTSQKLADLAILKPGDAVSLKIQVSSGSDVLPLEAEIRESIIQSLQGAESKVDQAAPISLSVKVTPKTEGTAQLSKIGDRSVSETVTRKLILINFSYKLQGNEVWNTSRQVSNLDRTLVRLKPGQSAQTAIDEQMLDHAKSLLNNMKLPRYIFKDSASEGLGSSTLIK